MILLLLGCVDQLYPGRVWSCDDWSAVTVYAPGPLQLHDAGPDDGCRISALGDRFPRPDDGVFVDADQVDVVGTHVLEGSWAPGLGVTDILLTDRDTDDGPLFDLVRIGASGASEGFFRWERTDAGEQLLTVECDRCTVRAREITEVRLRQDDSASSAWVCGVERLLVDSGQAGFVGYHDIDLPPAGGDVLWPFDERPTECSR